MVKLNPTRLGCHQQVKFPAKRADGSDLVVGMNEAVEVTDEEWKRVKGEKDEAGEPYLIAE
jgi:hypothetical protein